MISRDHSGQHPSLDVWVHRTPKTVITFEGSCWMKGECLHNSQLWPLVGSWGLKRDWPRLLRGAEDRPWV